MRVIRAVRELNDGRDDPIHLIALHTDPERGALFVRESDEAVSLGPATFDDPRDGLRKSRYLDREALERALLESRADAVWVGWGLAAGRPELIELCDRLGLVFVGPGAAAVRSVGDRISGLRLAEDAGLPVSPWSGGAVDSLDDAHRHCEVIGFPLMVKAAAGAGGRGIHRVDHRADLDEAFASARAEALAVFGDPTVYLEQLVSPARHLEVQVVADAHGAAWAVGVRDCTLQRRNQRVMEESGCAVLTDGDDRRIRELAVRLVQRSGYVNAGTVEFLYQPEHRTLSFLELNAQLQAEHPVTEVATGVDLVKLQLHVAAGGHLEGAPPLPVGHAVGAWLNAEDPARDFVATPGVIELLHLPAGPGIRVDSGVAEGDSIPSGEGTTVANIVALGQSREEALSRLRRALRETAVVVGGGTTNRGFLLDLLGRAAVRSGVFDSNWLDREEAVEGFAPSRGADLALVQAAIDVADGEDRVEQARFYGGARRGRPQATDGIGHEVELRLAGNLYHLGVWRIGPTRWRVVVDDATIDADLERTGAYEARLRVGDTVHHIVRSRHGGDLLVEVDGVAHRVSLEDAGLVRAPAPAVVVALRVSAGSEVVAGDPVVVLESMKMETVLAAPVTGRVREVLVGTNVQVDTGTPLLLLEPVGRPVDGGNHPRVVATAEPATPVTTTAAAAERNRSNHQLLEWLLLGYDLPDDEVHRVAAEDAELRALLGDGDPGVIEQEHRLLRLYATLRSLTRPQHGSGEVGEAARSPSEHFHAFLRSLDAQGEGLPPWYVASLEEVAAAYGIEGLHRSDELAEAMYRAFRALQRSDAQRSVVLGVLGRRLEHADELVGVVPGEFRGVLDRLVDVTRSRDALVADRAQLVRHRYYDQVVLDRARDAVCAEMEAVLESLIDNPRWSGPERDAAVELLVACPQPLAPLLTARLEGADAATRRMLLEVTARRYYRMRPLSGFGTAEVDGVELVVSEYVRDGVRHRLAAAEADLDDLHRAVGAVASWARSVPGDEVVIADLYAEHAGTRDPDALAAQLATALDGAQLPGVFQRVVVAAARPAEGRGMSVVDLFTFRPDVGGRFVEDRRIRGLHPMMAERLELWRFANFEIERLASTEDLHLFHGVASENPKDERLFAVAEVRDLTAVRDETDRVVALPELERMLGEALDGIRRFQERLPPERRLLWNRVLLYLWPPLRLDMEELRGVVGRLARGTEHLGIEMVLVRCRMPDGPGGELVDRVIRVSNPAGSGLVMDIDHQPTEPLKPLDEYTRKVVQARRRGAAYPYDLVQWLAPASTAGDGIPAGDFTEYDLSDDGVLVQVDRPPGLNRAGVVVGVIRNFTPRYPDGMTRVVLLGDPTKALGSIAEPECRRIMAALDLAEELDVPVDWFTLSAGARIAMDSGTENMDWVASVLRRIIEFTQHGGEVNVVVAGINVGAQPYWNAEATMLMHTRGILVMTPESAMVLTGKQALDYSGAVSAEDNFGIGGYERIMGPNGQAQYWAEDLGEACRVLIAHHEHNWVAPGERFPRRAHTDDPIERDIGSSPHHAPDSDFNRVGDIFSPQTNPERKKAFDIRAVMRATVDCDHPTLERWSAVRGGDTGVVWDAHVGGWPVTLVGIESRPLQRHGGVPADGPDRWTSGTLFPLSSKKIARAINATSGTRPLVVLANLSGFDGSPESMRAMQLEFGAEIGRSVVNFDGPIVFCVVSRFHGGAFVVFSRRLNDGLEALAVEGSRASVIGGAPAAAVVFSHEVDVRTRADPRVAELEARVQQAGAGERDRLGAELAGLRPVVQAEKRGELAAEFDAIHSVERALAVGSIDEIIPAAEIRPALVAAIDRGVARVLDRLDLTR